MHGQLECPFLKSCQKCVKLSGQRELLMSIRKRLSELLIVPTPQEQIDLLVQFGKDIREQLESKTSSNQ